MDEIRRMEDNLLLIRRTVGWSAEEFGNKIGVTRQTINNIEYGRNKLTKTQYIAMRSVLDAEIANYPDETQMLKRILDICVDHPEKYKEEDRKELVEKANLLTPAILAKTATRSAVSKEWMKAVAALGIAGSIALGPIGVVGGLINAWLLKISVSDDKKKIKDK